MKATQQLHEAGQSLWLDNITRGAARPAARCKRYIDELSVTGLTSNPTHLRPGDQEQQRLRRGDPRAGRRRARRARQLFFELALEDLTRAADLFRPIHERDQRRRRLGLAGGVAALAYDTAGSIAAAKQLHARAAASEPVHQDSRARTKAAGDRGGDLRGRADQRDAAVLARAVPRRGRAYMRGIERRIAAGLNPHVALGRLALRQPLGRRGRGQGAGGAAQPARHRGRAAHLQGLPRAARVAPLAAAAQRRRAPAAAAVGQHRHQGSRGVGHALREGARRAAHRQHDAREDAATPSPTTASSARCCRATAATAEAVLGEFAQGGRRCRRAGRAAPATTAPTPS